MSSKRGGSRSSRTRPQLARSAAALLAASTFVSAQNTSTGGAGNGLDNGGINSTARANTWAVVGAPQVSAQQLFRGQGNKVYILDKVENNPLQINGHPGKLSFHQQKHCTELAIGSVLHASGIFSPNFVLYLC